MKATFCLNLHVYVLNFFVMVQKILQVFGKVWIFGL